ncbi:hypothetical protein pmac_cds_110 [Pandoravirus macleodensis]|uniref:Uncharacterized protein n=1 Tax=Pandoravirus macleodensis TaxID=2107707 RepID=A0A2U7UEA5_9VIRU|nr:hypothetical protein pmac_cds_110 [Pandoravirus macleodensis]AVK76798.1 hypothetical protein pmac_cds_110 [Pandoravirus macleodensis]
MQSDNINNTNDDNNNNADAVASRLVQDTATAPLDQTETSSELDSTISNVTIGAVHDAARQGDNSVAGDRAASVPINDAVVVAAAHRHDLATPSSSDTDDGDDDEEDDLASLSVSKHAVGSASSSSSVPVASPASSDAVSNTTASRKRPLELSAAAIIKQQQQQVRKRRYVDSSHTVDGVRKHVTVACARVDTGGFKCTFTLEHRRLEGTLNQQRANAKGGDIIERRHDVFMIQDPQGDDAPFPDYDRVYDNFLRRGIDICDHVRSELVPIRAAPKEATSAADEPAATVVNDTVS